jgi:ABC-type Zn uptake system ZnuABC Zn-binding protein ZnuA
MNRKIISLLATCGILTLAACQTTAKTAAGAAIGAGIGSISGDTKHGAIIGGSAGLLTSIL